MRLNSVDADSVEITVDDDDSNEAAEDAVNVVTAQGVGSAANGDDGTDSAEQADDEDSKEETDNADDDNSTENDDGTLNTWHS